MADIDQPLHIEIEKDGRVVASGTAGQFREDLKASGIGHGHCAFELPLRLDHTVATHPFLLSLRVTGCDSIIVPPTHFQLQPFIGHLDGIEGLLVVGWACSTLSIDLSVEVEMLVDGEIIERITADRLRPDLADLMPSDGRHGYEWILPRPFVDGQPHNISARIANTPFSLSGGVPHFTLSPEQLTPEARRLLYLREVARQHLLGVEQALWAEGRTLCMEKKVLADELRLDSFASKRAGDVIGTPAVNAPKIGPSNLCP